MKSDPSLEDKIGQFLLGRLPRDEYLEMENAIREQPELARKVQLRKAEFDTAHELIADDIRTLFQRLREQEQEPGNLSPRWGRQWYYYAAAACVAALVFWLFFDMGDSKTESDITVMNLQPPDDLVLQMPLRNRTLAPPEQVAEVPSKTPPILPSKPLPDSRRIALAMNFYDKSLSDNGASAFRGSNSAGSQDAVDRAVASWQNKDYPEVIRQLNAVGPEHPRYYTAQLLLAYSNFSLGNYRAAAAAARKVDAWKGKRDESYVEKAQWLLVLSLLAGSRADTDEAFRAASENILKDTGHPYYADVTALRDKLSEGQDNPIASADAANFTPNPNMEVFVLGGSRSEGPRVAINNPQNDARFAPDKNGETSIRFAGTVEGTAGAALLLSIYDNKSALGKPLVSMPLGLKKDDPAGTSHFGFQQLLNVPPGLYYFTVGEQGLTPAYTGRFVIRN